MRNISLFVYGWWTVLVTLFYFFPGHECRGAALGFYIGVVPADLIATQLLGIHSDLSMLVIGALIASVPVLWSGWVWGKHSVGFAAKAVLIAGSLALGIAGFFLRYWDFDSFVSALSLVVPDTYEITRWDHINLVLLPLGLAAAFWWTTLWCMLVAIVAIRRSRRFPVAQTATSQQVALP